MADDTIHNTSEPTYDSFSTGWILGQIIPGTVFLGFHVYYLLGVGVFDFTPIDVLVVLVCAPAYLYGTTIFMGTHMVKMHRQLLALQRRVKAPQ